MAKAKVLYHATAAENIPSIAKAGLLPSENPNWGGAFAQESMGKVYFGPKPSTAMYYAAIVFRQKLEAENRASIPLCLRVTIPSETEITHGPKEYGVVSESWTEKPIPPQNIEVWWHGKWNPIKSVANYDWEEMDYSYSEDDGGYITWEGELVGDDPYELEEEVKKSFTPKTAAMETDEDFSMMGKVGPFYRIDTMRYDDIAAYHGKRFADAVRDGKKVTVYRAGKPGEQLTPGTFLSADKRMAEGYRTDSTESFGGPVMYKYQVDPKDLIHVENFEASELVYKPRARKSSLFKRTKMQIPWAEVQRHIEKTNPHEGNRDAWGGMSVNLPHMLWTKETIQPNDPRIAWNSLAPASKRDVKRYINFYKQNKDRLVGYEGFPAVVLTQEGSHLVVQDGAHRLTAIKNLNIPIEAYIGTAAAKPTTASLLKKTAEKMQIFYHGTTWQNAQKIATEGLKAHAHPEVGERYNPHTPFVWATLDKETAKHYGQITGKHDYSAIVAFKWNFDKTEPDAEYIGDNPDEVDSMLGMRVADVYRRIPSDIPASAISYIEYFDKNGNSMGIVPSTKIASLLKKADVPELQKAEFPTSKEYDAVRWVYQQYLDNNIQKLSWQDFQKRFQQFAQKYPNLWLEVRQNRPAITREDMDRWMDEAKPDQSYEIEHGTYHDEESSYRDVEQLVLRINQSANAKQILAQDPLLMEYVDMVGQSSEMSGHPANKKTIGWLRVDFINDDWLLVDEVQSDLVNSVSQAKLILEADTFEDFMASLTNDKVRRLVQEKGINRQNFQQAKARMLQHGYDLDKMEDIKQKLVKLSKDWAEYAIATLIDLARRHGIRNVAIHTAETISGRDEAVESEKIHMYYDNLAKSFGFKKQQLDVGDLKGNFWVRTASKTVMYHVTPQENVKSIAVKGLLPADGKLYFQKSPPQPDGPSSVESEAENEQTWLVVQIPSNVKLHIDPEQPEGNSFFAAANVPPRFISVILPHSHQHIPIREFAKRTASAKSASQMVFYHGTSAKSAKEIEETGRIAARPKVWCTTDEATAYSYASIKGEKDEDGGAIVAFLWDYDKTQPDPEYGEIDSESNRMIDTDVPKSAIKGIEYIGVPAGKTSSGLKFFPLTDMWISRAKAFLKEKWAERHKEMGREGEPSDMQGTCKFASLFAQALFGGDIKGNPDHQLLKVKDRILDLTDIYDPNTFHHDKEFFGNPEHEESMKSCEPRVAKWVEEFKQRYGAASKNASMKEVERMFPNLGGEIPEAERVPSTGQYAAVRTSDGQIFADPDWQRSTHVLFINRKRIPPDKVEDGGWVIDGVYDPTDSSDAGKYGARARAVLRTLRSYAASEKPTKKKKLSPTEEARRDPRQVSLYGPEHEEELKNLYAKPKNSFKAPLLKEPAE